MALASQKTYGMFTKSAIPQLFKKYAGTIDPAPYIAAAHVFPMRVNNHVAEDLIDWGNVPEDPMFQLAFPQPAMLSQNDMQKIQVAIQAGTLKSMLQRLAEDIRNKMNPHPANQKTENVPRMNGEEIAGMQHKYRETVLYFPSEGQFCHAFCSYCFRWAQFTSVGSSQTFKSNNGKQLRDYVASMPQVKDVLFTGGDPMVMSPQILSSYIDPLISEDGPKNLETVRIGSKSLAWWPYKYTTDAGAKDILGIFERVVKSGRQLAFQAHFSHPRELEHPVTQEAIRQIRMTGVQIRGQAPLVRHVNDSSDAWQYMWNLQAKLGVIPYYMFIERDTGASHYFNVPLAKAHSIFSKAYSGLAGTARTVRGPSMSASPGKVGVLGVESVNGEKVFILKFWQARDPSWVDRVFFAKYDAEATWLTDLKPAFGETEFFFEERYREIQAMTKDGSSGQLLLT
ncbi:putative L-lysine 2,3-aminomutase [Cladobotryum mycophilum]|uniref:L-lysine 2,3-aminomutase n=1 Tax=Cladobotryum mycophilum TaxID=491253 RepID=A0ABR0SRL0_9HYPO